MPRPMGERTLARLGLVLVHVRQDEVVEEPPQSQGGFVEGLGSYSDFFVVFCCCYIRFLSLSFLFSDFVF